MFAPFPEEKAKEQCIRLMDALDTYNRIDFEVPAEDADKTFETTCLLQDGGLGQMFGVCVCTDKNGTEHVLRAFSGQYNSKWLVPGWVPPLLDTQEFYTTTAESDRLIHELTDSIASLSQEIALLESKPQLLPEQKKTLTQLRRNRSALQKKRKTMSQNSMKEIFALYRLHCANGKIISFANIFAGTNQPPTGCGECCAPKLLDYAFAHELIPISLAEFYYGKENNSGTKHHKQFYTPCDEKCAPILPSMLGLEILYRDEYIVVINKPSGLLSIPGRGEDKADSATTRLKNLFPQCIAQPSVHRLDMDTSGLLVMAFTTDAHRSLSIQFMEGTVSKSYVAFLRGNIMPGSGCTVLRHNEQNQPIEGETTLAFRLDTEHRPYQIYDPIHGKIGVTHWEVLSAEDAVEKIAMFRLPPEQEKRFLSRDFTCVLFTPKTGRTHQLRLHSAHSNGLGCPIAGDNLYGTQQKGERLLLHACTLSFVHPITGVLMSFSSFN